MPAVERLKTFTIAILTCLLVATIVGAWQWSLTREALRDARFLQASLEPGAPDPARIVRALKVMKLVTVEIDTTVRVERGNENWRGDVLAQIEAPVRLSYGTDLSTMGVDRVIVSTLPGWRTGDDLSGSHVGQPVGAVLVRIPAPTRIATEVFAEREEPRVQTGWLRFRTRAGEYYLGQARKGLGEAARTMVLLPGDMRKVEEATREQVQQLVQMLVGERVSVIVRLDPSAEVPPEDKEPRP